MPSNVVTVTTLTLDPSAPANLVASVDDTQVILDWSTPEDTSSYEIVDYIVRVGTDAADLSTYDDGIDTNVHAVILDLCSATTYYFGVTAINAAGSSTETIISATTIGPVAVCADFTYSDDGTIKIRFSPRIDISESSVDNADFTVTDGTINIDVTNVSFTQYKAVLTLERPVDARNIETINISYNPQENRKIVKDSRTLQPFANKVIVNLLPNSLDIHALPTISADFTYSDDGTIKIRFSPRIDMDESSVDNADFTVTDGTNNIDVTNVSLTQYQAVLTLERPVDADNIETINISYNPQENREIVSGIITLAAFEDETVTSLLPGSENLTALRADLIYSDDGTIKIRFSPRIDIDTSSAFTADFGVFDGSTRIPITDISLTKYKVVLTLDPPVTARNVDTIRITYDPQYGIISTGPTNVLASFVQEPVTSLFK